MITCFQQHEIREKLKEALWQTDPGKTSLYISLTISVVAVYLVFDQPIFAEFCKYVIYGRIAVQSVSLDRY